VVAFVNASKLTPSDHKISRFSRDVQGLRRFLMSYSVSGSKRSLLENLFRGKSGYIYPMPVHGLTPAEQELFQAKGLEKGRKGLFMKKLKSL
jgi:hypothetical protein